MNFTPGKQLTAFILDLEYLLYRTYRTRILRLWVEEQLYPKILYPNLVPKDPSYPKIHRTQRYRTQREIDQDDQQAAANNARQLEDTED
uniref:Uncharacterized protein n=1 Tax=Caenorhabditis japonica TaxID=281687 RepID=A0A8R1E911_CAEJA